MKLEELEAVGSEPLVVQNGAFWLNGNPVAVTVVDAPDAMNCLLAASPLLIPALRALEEDRRQLLIAKRYLVHSGLGFGPTNSPVKEMLEQVARSEKLIADIRSALGCASEDAIRVTPERDEGVENG